MHPYFVGLDVHKRVIAYCVKTAGGEIVTEGKIPATRDALDQWVKTLPGPWHGGLEATMFSHWIFRHLEPHAARLEMGHPARMKAISGGKKKSDKLDARTLADLLRANLFPACYVMPAELEGLRRQLRFRRMVVEETVRFKNKTAGLLMEAGVEYERRRLHGKRYFAGVMSRDLIDRELRPLLEFSRSQTEELARMDDAPAGPASALTGAGGGAAPDRRRGAGDGAELGAGGGRSVPVFLHQTGGELLRVIECVAGIGGPAKARAALQAAQSSPANGVDRGVENRRDVSPETARSSRPGRAERPCESSDAGGGAQAGGVSAGRRSRLFRRVHGRLRVRFLRHGRSIQVIVAQ